ncbi:hypothetical protein J2T14_005989 [Paenibacillus harenae]|nr:hypothetical protein [Paenibacillus harenae]
MVNHRSNVPFYADMLEVPLEWLSTLHMTAMTGFTLAGMASLIALLTAYPMMRNASMQPKEKSQ